MEIIGKLSGGIAHDFNNILGVVNGYSEMLLRHRALDEASRHEVREILHAGKQAALLTRQLLAFSRKQILQPKVINLNDVIEDVEMILRRLMGEEIETTIRLQPDLDPIEADPAK
jgi:two-component system, cell cycle sensor histidine kinase and response regulator CckA